MIRVSDHALLRFLERVGGFDVEGVRANLEASFVRADIAARALEATNYSIAVDGHSYIVRGDTVTTVLPGDLSPRSRFNALSRPSASD